MKAALLVAAVMLAQPAMAKTWVDKACVAYLVSENDVLTFEFTNGTGKRSCDIAAWPIDNPQATLTCDDGTSPKMQLLADDAVEFDGFTMLPKGHKDIICD